MGRLIRVVLVAALLVTAFAAVQSSAAGTTRLRIVYFEDINSPETRIDFTLRCNPVGGNHPKRTAACRELARLGRRTLAPVPPDAVCTEIFGGPSVVIVSGRINGAPIWAKLRRDNGCQIARWERNWFLLPVAPR